MKGLNNRITGSLARLTGVFVDVGADLQHESLQLYKLAKNLEKGLLTLIVAELARLNLQTCERQSHRKQLDGRPLRELLAKQQGGDLQLPALDLVDKSVHILEVVHFLVTQIQ